LSHLWQFYASSRGLNTTRFAAASNRCEDPSLPVPALAP